MNLNKTNFKKIAKLEKEVINLLDNRKITHGLKRELRKVSKELQLYQNHMKGMKDWERRKKEIDNKRVQVGGGKHYLDGFLNIDIVKPADLVCDVREGVPLKDESTEFIFTEHFLEHIDYPVSVKKFVKECFRVLKRGGKLVIGVPDSKLVVKNYMKEDHNFYKRALEIWYAHRDCLSHFNTYIDLLNYYFRDQDDSEKYSPHLWAYDFEKLESLLKWAGFSSVERWRPNKSIVNSGREWWSIYIVGIK